MAGTWEGGKRAALTNRKKHGADFYKKIGAMGGKKGRTGGFYKDREMAKAAGQLGGMLSKRGQRFVGFDDNGMPQYIKG